jgi:hypothetical protein
MQVGGFGNINDARYCDTTTQLATEEPLPNNWTNPLSDIPRCMEYWLSKGWRTLTVIEPVPDGYDVTQWGFSDNGDGSTCTANIVEQISQADEQQQQVDAAAQLVQDQANMLVMDGVVLEAAFRSLLDMINQNAAFVGNEITMDAVKSGMVTTSLAAVAASRQQPLPVIKPFPIKH